MGNARIRPYHVAQFVKKLLPESAWPRFANAIYPLLRASRRGAQVSFEQLADGTWDASFEGHSQAVNFLEARRAERMIWPGGPRDAAARMLDRYLDDRIRVEEGDVVLDLGANIGEFSLLVGEHASRVIAVEGDPGPFRCLERNARRFRNIEPCLAVVGERTEEQAFFLSSPGADSSLIRPKRDTRHVQVTVKRVDDLLAELDIRAIDFLKLDAEGAEPEVLAGAASTLSTCRAVVVDGGPERTGTPTDSIVEEMLRRSGFDVWLRDHIVFALRPS